MPKRTFDGFDDYAEDYRSIHSKNIKLSGADSFYFAEFKVKLLQGYVKNETLRVLDVGCGDGATEIFMMKYFPFWKVEGIDTSFKSIEAAKQRSLPNAGFHFYDGNKIPFGENQFDIIFIAGVLHHINYDLHAAIIREILKVLKPGGQLFLFEHNPLNPLTRYLVNTCDFDKNAKLLMAGYTGRMLKKNGFRLVKKNFIIFFPRKGLLSKFIFLEKYLQWLPLGGQYFFIAEKTN
ncbi:MAG: class I SAM-dependent methyltransferase [Ferruginibacter sp.]